MLVSCRACDAVRGRFGNYYFKNNYPRDVRIWFKHSVYTHFPKDRNCEICKSGPKSQGPPAEDAMAEPHSSLLAVLE